MISPLPPALVSGVGAVLPSGFGLDAAWNCWQTGQSGLGPFASDWIDSRRIAGYGAVPREARHASRDAVPHKLRRFGTEPSYWAVHAAGQAMAASGIEWADLPETRRGLFAGQGDYTSPNIMSLQRALTASDQGEGIDLPSLTAEALYRRGADPFMSIKGLANNALALISLTHRFRGPGAAFVQNESAGIGALQQALLALHAGLCDVALVVACGSYMEPFTLAELWRRGLLLEDGERGLRSFDRQAAGTVLAEGAVALLLERPASAQARGIEGGVLIHAPGGFAAPRNCLENLAGSGFEEGYRQALGRLGGTLANVQELVVIADGRGVPALDALECRQLAAALPDGVPITSPRPLFGTIPAAGALLDVALATRILASGSLPPVAGLTGPFAPQLDWAVGTPRPVDCGQVLCLQQGFSGFHSAVLVTRHA